MYHQLLILCKNQQISHADGDAPREIAILETADDIQKRRDQVLTRYDQFKDATKARREQLEEARRYMLFNRDADELESWLNEKLQTAGDDSPIDPTNLQVRQEPRVITATMVL